MARREDDPADVCMVIHGHFYQPPRENPWLEAIEREAGATPFLNWNARIADECYRTNGWARIFNDKGHVKDIVNNYTYLSFNFGPTLLSWLEEHLPRVYARILLADRLSIQERSGHGNALAQGYGHAILPLCNDHDRLTQIRWGKRDFQFRFGREPEAMWLPETAVDEATVEDLISEGMRFVILAPRQARRVRRLGEERWIDVGPDKIDPRMPYRAYSTLNPDTFIDVFFYDGPVAHAISFENVLHSSKDLVDKLWGAVDAGRNQPQLIHAAVDGETFGHHMRHAERALSYAFCKEAPERGLRLTNYGEYLEQHPPTHEVELDFGPEGAGSSWSCAHGIGRWQEDCGCHAGAPQGWNQAWRRPLRQAVNLVRDEAATLFEQMGADLFVDPWRARDAYIELLLDTSPKRREWFFDEHRRQSGAAQQVRMLKLLEMQRHSLLAQTSCGWFFNDISGLEAVQVLKYAARAVQLMEELSDRNVEKGLMEVLSEARSNVPGEGTGADIYVNRVLPASVGPHRLVAQYVITDMFRDYPEDHRFYGHLVHRVEGHRLTSGPVTMSVGRLQVEFLRTGESNEISYALIHFGGHDFHCAVRPLGGMQEFRRFTEQLERMFSHATITELLRMVDAHFGEAYFGLQHLLSEEREEVLEALFGHMAARFTEMYTRLYEDNNRAMSVLMDTGFKVPREFRMAAEYVLSRRLNEEVRRQRGSRDPDSYHRARQVVQEAERRGYRLDKSDSEQIFDEMITKAVREFVHHPCATTCQEVLVLVDLAESLDMVVHPDRAQDMLFDLLRKEDGADTARASEPCIEQLLAKLELSSGLIE